MMEERITELLFSLSHLSHTLILEQTPLSAPHLPKASFLPNNDTSSLKKAPISIATTKDP
jgi:hypothetical protein